MELNIQTMIMLLLLLGIRINLYVNICSFSFVPSPNEKPMDILMHIGEGISYEM